MIDTAGLQNRFQASLMRTVNGRAPSRVAQAVALIAPDWVAGRGVPGLVSAYPGLRRALETAAAEAGGQTVEVRVRPYDGPVAQVRQIMAGLRPIEDCLVGAYVHGSLADGEYNAYSDFDGLVILDHSAFASPGSLRRVCRTLRLLQRPMIEFDPLQHHGWFVLTAADLAWHCEAYFPGPLFSYARSLLPDRGTHLRLLQRDSRAEARNAFDNLARAVWRKAAGTRRPRDAFALKSELSQFMLLPALYLQARDGMGVYKKASFALARADFPEELWRPMDEVSAIRTDWHYRMEGWRRLLLTGWLAGRKLTTHWFAPQVPRVLDARLTPELRVAIARLAAAMRERVGSADPSGQPR